MISNLLHDNLLTLLHCHFSSNLQRQVFYQRSFSHKFSSFQSYRQVNWKPHNGLDVCEFEFDFLRCCSLRFLDLQLMLCNHDARICLQGGGGWAFVFQYRWPGWSQHIRSALHVWCNANLINVMQRRGQVFCHSDEQRRPIMKLRDTLYCERRKQ